MATTVPVNIWVRGQGWFGPSYPNNGDPDGWDPTAGDLPDLDELDPDDPSRQPGGEGQGSDDPEPPPRSGTGSGAAAWRAYAQLMGVDVADNAKQGEVIAALEAADVRTE